EGGRGRQREDDDDDEDEDESAPQCTLVDSPPRDRPRKPASLAPFCPGCVLMSSIERAIHAVPLVIAIRLKRVKQVFPLARLRPALEAIEQRLATSRSLQAEPAKDPRSCATTAPLRYHSTASMKLRSSFPGRPAQRLARSTLEASAQTLVQLPPNHAGLPMEHTAYPWNTPPYPWNTPPTH